MSDEKPSPGCAACGKAFVPRRATSRFCSRPCARSQNGKNQRRTGARWRNNRGYIELRLWIDGRAVRVKEHRWVVEQVLGRKLLPSEDVHHKNGIKTDNRPENLEVISHGRHSAEHTNRERIYRRGYKMNLSEAERERRRAWATNHWGRAARSQRTSASS